MAGPWITTLFPLGMEKTMEITSASLSISSALLQRTLILESQCHHALPVTSGVLSVSWSRFLCSDTLNHWIILSLGSLHECGCVCPPFLCPHNNVFLLPTDLPSRTHPYPRTWHTHSVRLVQRACHSFYHLFISLFIINVANWSTPTFATLIKTMRLIISFALDSSDHGWHRLINDSPTYRGTKSHPRSAS